MWFAFRSFRDRAVRRLAAWTIAIAVAGVALGLPGANAGAQSAMPVLRIATTMSDDYTPVLYALNAGLFKRAGFDVQVTVLVNGSAIAAAVAGDVARTDPRRAPRRSRRQRSVQEVAGVRPARRPRRELDLSRRSGLRIRGQRISRRGRGGAAAKGRIHDHAHIYTLYGVLGGSQKIERYDRLDDRSKPGYAEIRVKSDSLVGRGVIDLVRPYEVHSETNIGERTVAVIIRSEQGGSFNQGRYVPEKSEYYESLGPRQTPVDMLDPEHGTEPLHLARS